MNKFLKIISIALLLLINVLPVYAEDTIYSIYNFDGTSELLLETSSFDEAYVFYTNNKKDFNNLALYEDDKVLYMEYGTLYIKSNDEKVKYYSEVKEDYVEISNYNEYDLLYLSEDNGNVKFILENDIGYIEKDLVTYCPYGSRSVSYYDSINGSMYQHVASSINNYYKYNFMLDESLSFMNKNVKYFSYDSHYFYDNFLLMSDDYRNNNHDNALNKDDPYFNYYAFLPSRSYTNYSAEDFNYFFKDTFGIEGRLNSFSDFDKDGANDSLNLSELYETGKAFVSSEKIYGVNALSSLSLALLESNYGKSSNAYIKSNLYNHEALDSIESSINKYSSITNSIYSHNQNFVSRGYADLFATYYKGSFMGDFAWGMGSFYSYNPLFSKMYTDKTYFIDKNLGLKDRNEYSLAITTNNITMYYDKGLSSSYKIFRNICNSFIVLEAGDNYYKVQNDYSMNQTGEYNPYKSVMYVKNNLIEYLISGRNNSTEYIEYKIDYRDISNDGIISLYSKNDFDIEKDFVYKDIYGYDILGYELKDDIYVPKYKKIIDIKEEGMKYPSITNDLPSIKDGKLQIIYDDNTSKKINLTSDEIVSISNDNETTNIKLFYKGIIKDIEIQGSFDFNKKENNIESFARYSKYNYASYTFDDVRNFDNTYSLDDSISTYIKENEYDFSVEGCNPNFIYYKSDVFPTIINTYYFDINHINNNNKLQKLVSNFNLSYVDSFKIKVKRSLYHIDFISPMLMQIKLSSIDPNATYTIYYKEHDGSFTKLPVEFSNNYVRFLANSDGEFYVYKYNGPSRYDLKDSLLTNTITSNGKDYYSVILEGLIFGVIVIIGYLLIALYYIFKRKELKPWKDFKNSLQKAELLQEEKLKH